VTQSEPLRPRTREQAKEASREALIAAGVEEFARRGLDLPSLDAICARAGYTRGAFYVHFRDRDDFIAAIMERVLGDFFDKVIANDEPGEGLERTISSFIALLGVPKQAILDLPMPKRGERGFRFHDFLQACERSPEVRRRFVSLLIEAGQRLARKSSVAQQSGSVREDLDPTHLGLILTVLAVGALACLDAGVRFDVDGGRENVLRMLRKG
jgi:AcrR family transcriptional regulator